MIQAAPRGPDRFEPSRAAPRPSAWLPRPERAPPRYGRGSIWNSTVPALTFWPSLKSAATIWPSTRLLIVTAFDGCTVPIASSTTGTSASATVPAVTGTVCAPAPRVCACAGAGLRRFERARQHHACRHRDNRERGDRSLFLHESLPGAEDCDVARYYIRRLYLPSPAAPGQADSFAVRAEIPGLGHFLGGGSAA